MDSERIRFVIVGAVAVVLQLLLSPVIAIGAAVPSFIVVATMVMVMLDAEQEHYVFAFVMGLIADLTGSAPLGSTSIGLLLLAYALPRAVEVVGNDNALMSLIILLVGTFAYELVFSIFVSIAGFIGFLDAFAAIILPCTLYNTVLAFVFLLIMQRMGSGRTRTRGGTTMSNIRFN